MTSIVRERRPVLVGLLFSAMGAATLAPPALGILATFIIDDLAISRSTLGWIVTTNVLVAAALSPFAGTLTDHLGGRRALVFVFVMSALAFATLGLATGVLVMVAGSAFAALSQAGANPATNRLIGDVLPRGERGIVTGVKQSGVQAAITVAGLTLPTIGIALGWRGALLAVSLGPLLLALVALFAVPRTPPKPTHSEGTRRALPPSTFWLAAYGCIFGFAGSVTFFLALFAEESLGLDPRLGGVAVAVAGLTAFVSRIAWARHAERTASYRGPLRQMAILGVVAGSTLLASSWVAWLLWPGAVLTGTSTSAWNSVGMLAVIDEAGTATGRASGVVLLGFLVGLGIGPPLYGALADSTGSYTPMWILSIAASVAAVATVTTWSRRHAAATV